MRNMILPLLLLMIVTNAVYSQSAINYGNNASAGKYYNIRGVRMYCEIYGEGNAIGGKKTYLSM